MHSSAIVVGGVISEGQRVAFVVVEGEKGPQADHLLPLGAEAAPAGRGGPTERTDPVSFYDVDKGFGFVTPDPRWRTPSSTSGRWPAGWPSRPTGIA